MQFGRRMDPSRFFWTDSTGHTRTPEDCSLNICIVRGWSGRGRHRFGYGAPSDRDGWRGSVVLDGRERGGSLSVHMDQSYLRLALPAPRGLVAIAAPTDPMGLGASLIVRNRSRRPVTVALENGTWVAAMVEWRHDGAWRVVPRGCGNGLTLTSIRLHRFEALPVNPGELAVLRSRWPGEVVHFPHRLVVGVNPHVVRRGRVTITRTAYVVVATDP